MDIIHFETPKTSSGLVVKHTERIAQIHTRMEVNIEPLIQTWQISRWVRRDFNYVSTKMYLKCLHRPSKVQVRDLLAEVVVQSEFLQSYAVQFEMSFDLGGDPVPIRLVSPEAAMLYKTIMVVDNSMARLHCAQTDLKLSYKDATDIILPFFSALSDLKHYCLNTKQKTSAEIAAENGIE